MRSFTGAEKRKENTEDRATKISRRSHWKLEPPAIVNQFVTIVNCVCVRVEALPLLVLWHLVTYYKDGSTTTNHAACVAELPNRGADTHSTKSREEQWGDPLPVG